MIAGRAAGGTVSPVTKKATLPRYAAFLRGVSPMNAKMPELAAAFEAAGFQDVKTVLSSGNVVFSARRASEAALEKKAEAAMKKHLGRTFLTIVRPVDHLREMLANDPYAKHRVSTKSKRVVTFLRTEPEGEIELPMAFEDARILALAGRDVFTTYVPGPRGGAFMGFIEKTFGKDVTTRTWDTVKKVAK